MASFPTLSTGSIATSIVRTAGFQTTVHRFEDDSEQRYCDRVELAEFTLELDSISFADYDLVQTFFDARAGDFDATWDITVSGTLYSNCVFVDSLLSRTESKPGRVAVSIRVRQVHQ